ncbi:rubredoxin [Lentisalinibacter orientalis]|uniref:rubredoxin n=1 Tax=Lentisalinibacter orientalis TaxID=2992241 RepID=UPI003863C990
MSEAEPLARYECPDCGYVYDEASGDDHEGYPPRMKFRDLPEEFVCPDCAVRYKEDFVRIGE